METASTTKRHERRVPKCWHGGIPIHIQQLDPDCERLVHQYGMNVYFRESEFTTFKKKLIVMLHIKFLSLYRLYPYPFPPSQTSKMALHMTFPPLPIEPYMTIAFDLNRFNIKVCNETMMMKLTNYRLFILTDTVLLELDWFNIHH